MDEEPKEEINEGEGGEEKKEGNFVKILEINGVKLKVENWKE